MSGNRVDRRTALDRTNREGGLGVFRNFDVGNDIAGTANGVNGARSLTEVSERVRLYRPRLNASGENRLRRKGRGRRPYCRSRQNRQACC